MTAPDHTSRAIIVIRALGGYGLSVLAASREESTRPAFHPLDMRAAYWYLDRPYNERKFIYAIRTFVKRQETSGASQLRNTRPPHYHVVSVSSFEATYG